jgi:hypothetical protein
MPFSSWRGNFQRWDEHRSSWVTVQDHAFASCCSSRRVGDLLRTRNSVSSHDWCRSDCFCATERRGASERATSERATSERTTSGQAGQGNSHPLSSPSTSVAYLCISFSGSPYINLSSSPYMNLSSSPYISFSSSPYINLSSSPYINLSGSPYINLSGLPLHQLQ